jgi:hypothetical protein
MRPSLPRAAFAAVFVAAVAVGFTTVANAGGSFDDDQPRPDQLSYFGFVRDTHGLGVGDAKVAADVRNGASVVTHTDILGVYRLPGLSVDTNPDDVTISCAKDGYRQTRVLRRTTPGPNVKAYEVECTMENM